MYSYCYKSSMSTASSSYSRYSYFNLSTLYFTCIHTVTRAVCQQQAAHTPGNHTSVLLHCIGHVFILLQEQYVNSKQLILQVFILHSLSIVLHMYSYCYKSSTSTASSSYSRYSYFTPSPLYYTCIHTVTRAVWLQKEAHTPGIHTSVPLHCIHTVRKAVWQQKAAHTPDIHTSVPLHCIHVFILLQE